MRPDILFKIRSDKNLDSYIKYHSYWYKILIREPERIIELEEEMKTEYKLTTGDKIERFGNKLEMINSFINILN